MKVRASPIRVRLIVATAFAFALLSLLTTFFELRVMRKGSENADDARSISSAQLVKLYIETSVPGQWKERGGYLYRGEERLSFGPSIRGALEEYLPPDTTVLFGTGSPPAQARGAPKEASAQDVPVLEPPPAPGPPPDKAPRQMKKPDIPFHSVLGSCAVVRGEDGEIVGWLAISSGERRRTAQENFYRNLLIVGFGAIYLLIIAVFGARILRLTKPIDVLAEERELALAKNAELANISRTDPLTGLLNRRGLSEIVSNPLSRHGLSHVAMLDIDHFKAVNDERGHDEGDRVLRAVAETLSASVRAADFCGRWGGEEFVIAFRGLADEHASASAERIRAWVEARAFGGGAAPLRVTVTIGVSAVAGGDFEAAVAAADRAMYRGKQHGRNRVVMASSECE